MEKYISGEDSGPVIGFEVDNSAFGELETIGMAEDIQGYIKGQKKTLTFNYTEGGSVHSNPFWYKGVVYFGACDKNMYAVTEDGKLMWKFGCGDIPFHPVVHDDVVYFGSYDGNFYAVSAKTGEPVWRLSVNSKIACQPCVTESVVYFGSEDGDLYAVDLNGKLMWKFHAGEYLIATPLVHKGTVLFGCGNGIFYAVDSRTGELKWKFTANSEIGSAVVYKDVIYVPSYDHSVYALDLNGKLLWSFKTLGPLCYRKLCMTGDAVIFGSYDTNVYAVDLNGNLVWKFRPTKYIFNTPTFRDGLIYFGSTDYNIYALDAKTGKKVWVFNSNGGVISNPLVHGDRIYFGCWDCNLYCITTDGELVWKFKTGSSKRVIVNVPAPVKKKISRFIMKPQEVERKGYKTSISGEAHAGEMYAMDMGKYIVKSEYSMKSEYTGKKKKSYM